MKKKELCPLFVHRFQNRSCTIAIVFLMIFTSQRMFSEGDNDQRFVESSLLPVKCGLPSVVRAIRDQDQNIPGGTDLFVRNERQKSKLFNHFRVHYDTLGADAAFMLDQNQSPIPGTADTFADSVLSIADQVWNQEVDVLGYFAPPSDGQEGGGAEYDIYVLNLGTTYGSTYTETPIDNIPDG